MAFRPHGHAEVDSSAPRAWATCDRCSRLFNLYRLSWQFDWRGPQLQNLRILVCDECLDNPQPQLKPIILPADPVPVANPRPEPYALDENNIRTTTDGDPRVIDGGSSYRIPIAADDAEP